LTAVVNHMDEPTEMIAFAFDPIDIDEPTTAATVDFDRMEIDGLAELNTNRIRSRKNAFGCHSESISYQDTKGCPTCKHCEPHHLHLCSTGNMRPIASADRAELC
jgi:hypothetical protein